MRTATLLLLVLITCTALAQRRRPTPKAVKTSYDLSPITTRRGTTIRFIPADSTYSISWTRNKKRNILQDERFRLEGADGWFPRIQDEHKDYIVMSAGCGNPCWYGIFLPLYGTGKARVIGSYLGYDLDQHYVACFDCSGKSGAIAVLNLKTSRRERFRTGHCRSAFAPYCIDTLYFKGKSLYYRWMPGTAMAGKQTNKKGQWVRLKLSI